MMKLLENICLTDRRNLVDVQELCQPMLYGGFEVDGFSRRKRYENEDGVGLPGALARTY